MKKSALYVALLVCIFYSCNRNQNSSGNDKTTGTIAKTQCYVSTAGSDSASLFLKDQYGRISGSLSMYFEGKDNMTGSIAGTFKGDTLFADYTYRLGDKEGYYRNPLAFLKKDGKLYQGYGEVATSYGRSDFKKDSPITFDKGFVFSEGDCE